MDPKKPTNVDTNALVESVKNDMLNIERGKQWIMSSYSPFKDKVAFPGFVDDSFEEIRLGYYDSQKTGSGDIYFQQIQAKHQEALLRVKRLQIPSPDIVSIFVQLYNTPAPVIVSSASGHFGNILNPIRTNIFNPSANQSTWGTPQTNSTSTNVFGTSTSQSNPFATPNSTNIFAKPVNSIFGTSSSSAGTNIFAAKPSTAPVGQSSIFGQSSANHAPVFGASGNSAFGSQSLSNNLYAGSTTGGSIFGSSNAQGGTIFGSQATATNSIFGGGSASSGPAVFGAPTVQQSRNAPLFGNGTSQPSTIFGSSSIITPAVFGTTAVTPVFSNPSSSGFSSSSVQLQSQSSIFGTTTLSNTAPGAQIFGAASSFGTSNALSVSGIFNKTSASFLNPQPLFGSNTAAAATSQPPSIFGSASASIATTAASIFGSNALSITTPQPSSFGSILAATPSSIFGGSSGVAAISQSPASMFGCGPGIATTQPTSIFNRSGSIATSSQPLSIFGTAVGCASQPTSIFGGTTSGPILKSSPSIAPSIQNSTSIFGNQPATATFGQSGIFGTSETLDIPSSGSLFMPAAISSSNTPFASTAVTSFAPVTTSATLFTTVPSVGSSPFATVSPFVNPVGVRDIGEELKPKLTPKHYAKTNPEYYSTELSDRHIAAFRQMTFEFGEIPVTPPTVDLCA